MRTCMADGDPSHYAQPRIDQLAPDLKRINDEALFGQIWNRLGLANVHRCMSTMSALMALGHLPFIRRHIGRSHNLGVTPEQVVEVFVHLVLCGGYINSGTTMRIAKSVFTEQGLNA